jgi:glutamyl-tRNA synthetase
MTVVTRFAPSPTGYLHIGGARTALFNWLYARRHGGRYLLRIEDTDRERSTEAAVAAIFDGLDWLGLTHDGPATFQFARATRHAQAAEELLSRGGAYRCYCTAEEVEALRAAAHAQGRPLRSPWRDRPAREALQGGAFTVRLRAGDDGDTVIRDRVQGEVRIRNTEIDDLVLLRSDGTPTYMLAVVVDDFDMGVTHVIRGDDHLTNAARQMQIIQGLGWPAPVYAHVPMIYGPDGAKLSKRHGAVGVHAYRDMGYLPEAMRNYLVRLGWSHGDDEIFSTEQAIAWFDIDHIGRSPARLDFNKLNAINAHWMRDADNARLAGLVLDALMRAGVTLDAPQSARVGAAMGVLKHRAKTILELADQTTFLTRRHDTPLDEKSRQSIAGEAGPRLNRLKALLGDARVWEAEPLAALLKAFAESEGVSLGKVGPPLRAALTGGAPSPDLGVMLALLGRDEALARLSAATA